MPCCRRHSPSSGWVLLQGNRPLFVCWGYAIARRFGWVPKRHCTHSYQESGGRYSKNRRGAEPLHYAADGAPGSRNWNPQAQAEMITLLISSGANPNALDKSGVAPLHRAVRQRCAGAVDFTLAERSIRSTQEQERINAFCTLLCKIPAGVAQDRQSRKRSREKSLSCCSKPMRPERPERARQDCQGMCTKRLGTRIAIASIKPRVETAHS